MIKALHLLLLLLASSCANAPDSSTGSALPQAHAPWATWCDAYNAGDLRDTESGRTLDRIVESLEKRRTLLEWEQPLMVEGRVDCMLATSILDEMNRRALAIEQSSSPIDPEYWARWHAGARLDLAGSAIRDLTPVCALTELKVLHLERNQIENLAVFLPEGPCAKLSGLHQLFLQGNRLGSIAPLSTLRNLKILDVSSTDLDDCSPTGTDCPRPKSVFDDFNRNPYLFSFSARDNHLHTLRGVAELRGLLHLAAGGNRIKDLNPVTALPLVAMLSLDRNRIAAIPASLTYLSPSLTQLDLSGQDEALRADVLKTADEFGELRLVDLDANSLSPCDLLIAHPGLTGVHLGFGPEMASTCVAPALERLGISGPAETASAVLAGLTASSLKVLDLSQVIGPIAPLDPEEFSSLVRIDTQGHECPRPGLCRTTGANRDAWLF